MFFRPTLMAWAGLALALAACRSDEPRQHPDPSSTRKVAAAEIGGVAISPAGTQDFIGTAASGGMYEVESGKLAQQKASEPQIQAFAAMMVRDHTKANDELKAAAARLDPSVSVPPAMSAEHQELLNQLESTTANFDSAYLDQQVLTHEKTQALLNSYIARGESQPIRDWAKTSFPVVQRHLDKVRDLAGRM